MTTSKAESLLELRGTSSDGLNPFSPPAPNK